MSTSGAADFFKELQRNLKKLESEIAGKIVKVEANKFHAKNFKDQSFTDEGAQKWPARKKSVKPSRALLVLSSNLKRKATHGKKRGKYIDYVLPNYGRVHNEGLKAGRGSGFMMPQRRFIGKSKYLDEQIRKKAIKLLNKRLNRL